MSEFLGDNLFMAVDSHAGLVGWIAKARLLMRLMRAIMSRITATMASYCVTCAGPVTHARWREGTIMQKLRNARQIFAGHRPQWWLIKWLSPICLPSVLEFRFRVHFLKSQRIESREGMRWVGEGRTAGDRVKIEAPEIWDKFWVTVADNWCWSSQNLRPPPPGPIWSWRTTSAASSLSFQSTGKFPSRTKFSFQTLFLSLFFKM